MVYRFREGRRLSGDPQAVGEALEALARRDGRLTPATVVEAARSARSVLHRYFEWEDGAAAEKWRQEQARGLIQCVYVVAGPVPGPAGRGGPRVAYLHVPQEDGGACYEPTGTVLDDEAKYQLVLGEALRSLEALRRRYEHLVELRPVFRAAARARARLRPVQQPAP